MFRVVLFLAVSVLFVSACYSLAVCVLAFFRVSSVARAKLGMGLVAALVLVGLAYFAWS